MKVVVSGSTGLLGSALIPFLRANGCEVSRLVRPTTQANRSSSVAAAPDDIAWDPGSGIIEAEQLEGVDALVYLAGENVAGYWTAAKKERIRRSRIESTRLLRQCLSELKQPPKVLVSASAIGYYGDRGEQILREDSPPGSGFLPEVCRAWEAAATGAENKATDSSTPGMRVVVLRIGIVLSPRGGALAQMLPVFRLGLGGRMGSGKQYWSWVSLDDTVRAIHHAFVTPLLHGPVNIAAPAPVRNAQFTRSLGKVLGRPTVLAVPAFALRLVLGQMAEEALLASARVEPARLAATGFSFEHTDLEDALKHLLAQ